MGISGWRSPILNISADCMHAGPSLLPNLMDSSLCFLLQRVRIISEIEKAFLNISITPEQRNFLTLLWVDNIKSAEPKLEIYRFTLVMFGAFCSPYLLNVTIRHHLEKHQNENEEFVDNVIKFIYCDDFIASFDSEEVAFAQNSKLKECFIDAGLNLRKLNSNSQGLTQKITIVENNIEQVLDAIKENFEITACDLKSCRNIEINRHYVSSRESQELITSMEVHGFFDASMKAYGSCIYII